MKASNLRFFGAMFTSMIVLLALILFIPTYEPVSAEASETINFEKVKTNEDRVGFLAQFGWTVASEPVESVEVTIPSEFDSVFLEYNNLQKMQGLDLSKYKRKKITRYTYEITNYEDWEGTVYANLLIYKNKVIGGDICSADVSGFVTTFDNQNKVG
jgi:hypothetical protein